MYNVLGTYLLVLHFLFVYPKSFNELFFVASVVFRKRLQRYGFLPNLQAMEQTFFQKNCRMWRKPLYYNDVIEHIFFFPVREWFSFPTLLYMGMTMKGASIIRRGSLLLRSAKAERSLKILYLGIEDIFGHRSALAERKRKKACQNGKAGGNRSLTYVTNDETVATSASGRTGRSAPTASSSNRSTQSRLGTRNDSRKGRQYGKRMKLIGLV